MNVDDAVDILLVEDDPQDARLTIRALGKCNLDSRLHLVVDGAEALDFLFYQGKYARRGANRKPKLILLDLKLPKINGLEVLQIIKSNEGLRRIPVVILTSSQEDADVRAAYDLGVNSYVVKPVNFEIFTQTIVQLGLYWVQTNLILG